jgi:hypothetical protein
MATPAGDAASSVALTELSERQRERALVRYKKLRPHLEDDVPLAGVAKEASLPLRIAQRWVSLYRRFGLIGLIRAGRADQGKRRRVPDDLRRLAEGLALERPPLGPSAIYREVCRIARARGEQAPGYHTIYNVTAPFPTTSKRSLLISRRPIAKPTTWFIGVKPNGRTRSGKPITPSSISGPNGPTARRHGRG